MLEPDKPGGGGGPRTANKDAGSKPAGAAGNSGGGKQGGGKGGRK